MSRVTIFSKEGYFLGDLRVATVRSWTLAATGVVGQCEFDMSLLDPKVSRKYIDYGKIVLVRDPYLPDWVGIIYPPRAWGHDQVTVRAYQAESVLKWRNTPTEKIAGQPGEIFREILNVTNAARNNEKPIKANSIFAGGNVIEETLGDYAYVHVQAVAERSGHDFDVIHVFDVNGRLTFQGNWYERKGTITGHTLQEGYNLELSSNILNEQGDLVNAFLGYTDSSTPASRLSFMAWNEASQARIGLFEGAQVFSGVTQETTLREGVISQLERMLDAEKVLDLVALNVGNTYSYLGVGNLWNVDLNRAGFATAGFGYQTIIRIMGMEVDDLVPNKVKLVTEVQDA